MSITNNHICDIIFDHDYNVIKCSDSVMFFFSLKTSDLLSNNFLNYIRFSDDSLKSLKDNIEVLNLGREPEPLILKNLQRSEGDEFEYLKGYLEYHQELYRLILIDHTSEYYDTVQLHKTYLDLKKANSNKDKFVSLLAHDLRGPIANLNVIFEEILAGELELDQELGEILNSSSRSALSLIENILTWATSSDYQFNYQRSDFLIDDLFNDVVELLRPISIKKNVSIKFEKSSLQINSDKQSLMTIVRNLVNNSLKFTKSGGEITLKAYKDSEYLNISITDNGIGFEVNNDEGYADSTTGTEGEVGTGLGIPFCQLLTSGLGGELIINSNVGIGTEAIIRFADM